MDQIGAKETPQIEIYNKIDLIDDAVPKVERDQDGRIKRIWVSAASGEGIDLLLEGLTEFFNKERVLKLIQLAPADGRLRARLFEIGLVLSEHLTDDGGWQIEVELSRKSFERLIVQEPDLEHRLVA